jgi:hypothetical protein
LNPLKEIIPETTPRRRPSNLKFKLALKLHQQLAKTGQKQPLFTHFCKARLFNRHFPLQHSGRQEVLSDIFS